MNRKIIIAGGTGFIGSYLTRKFTLAGYNVIIISRQQGHIGWLDEHAIRAAIENAAMLINLAGKSVDCRYNEKNKKEIFDSRINTTKILGNAILNCTNPPPLWINSSTATIYRHAQDRPMTEYTGEIGSGFSVNVATNWEKAFFDFKLTTTRQVALRMAIVLGDGGVMRPLKRLVHTGMGGKHGSGNQMFSWIHIDDLYRIITFIQQQKELTGVFNASSPNPVTNKTVMKTLRKVMSVKIAMRLPVPLLKLGAILIKTETELILKSRWVIPERLLNAGYSFRFPELDEALKQILYEHSEQAYQ